MLAALGAVVIDADAIVHELQAPGTPLRRRARARPSAPACSTPRARSTAPRSARSCSATRRRARGSTRSCTRRSAPSSRAALAAARAAGARAASCSTSRCSSRAARRARAPRRALRFDATVLVYAPEALQIERQIARDGCSREEALRRVRAQLPIEEKKRARRLRDRQQRIARRDRAPGPRRCSAGSSQRRLELGDEAAARPRRPPRASRRARSGRPARCRPRRRRRSARRRARARASRRRSRRRRARPRRRAPRAPRARASRRAPDARRSRRSATRSRGSPRVSLGEHRQPRGPRGRRRQQDRVHAARRAARPKSALALLGRQVHDDQAVDADGRRARSAKAALAHREQVVGVAHQDDRHVDLRAQRARPARGPGAARRPPRSARSLARWIVGPSPIGSENGTPISISVGARLARARAPAPRWSARSGSPAVTNGISAFSPRARSARKRSPMRPISDGRRAAPRAARAPAARPCRRAPRG